MVCRTGSDGYQPKFVTVDGQYFIKVQCDLGGELMADWKVECIASNLCQYFGVSCIVQQPCRVFVDGRERYGVCSPNLTRFGGRFESFESVLEQHGYSSGDAWFVKESPVGKINNMAAMLSKCTGLPEGDVRLYLLWCAVMDILVYNNDRHTRNYHIFRSVDGVVSLAPLHDFGMGLFENDREFHAMASWQECNRYCYIAPYGEDAFDLLGMLDKAYGVVQSLRRWRKPVLNKSWFPSGKAYDYWLVISSKVWG